MFTGTPLCVQTSDGCALFMSVLHHFKGASLKWGGNLQLLYRKFTIRWTWTRVVSSFVKNGSVISFLNFQNGDVISLGTAGDIGIVEHVHIIKQERMALYKICPSVQNHTKLQFIHHRFLQQLRCFSLSLITLNSNCVVFISFLTEGCFKLN